MPALSICLRIPGIKCGQADRLSFIDMSCAWQFSGLSSCQKTDFIHQRSSRWLQAKGKGGHQQNHILGDVCKNMQHLALIWPAAVHIIRQIYRFRPRGHHLVSGHSPVWAYCGFSVWFAWQRACQCGIFRTSMNCVPQIFRLPDLEFAWAIG